MFFSILCAPKHIGVGGSELSGEEPLDDVAFDVRLKMPKSLFLMIMKFCDLVRLEPDDFFRSALMYSLSEFCFAYHGMDWDQFLRDLKTEHLSPEKPEN